MAQNVLVFTRVEGEDLHIGKCSHAQARILSKKGHGRIDGGKLFVNLRPVHLQVAKTVEREDNPNVSHAEIERRQEWLAKIVMATLNAETGHQQQNQAEAIQVARLAIQKVEENFKFPDEPPMTDEEVEEWFVDDEAPDAELPYDIWDRPYGPNTSHRLEAVLGMEFGQMSADTPEVTSEEERQAIKASYQAALKEMLKDVEVVEAARLPRKFYKPRINGTPVEVPARSRKMSYEDVVKADGKDPDHHWTVTYSNAEPPKTSGTLYPGSKPVTVTDDTRINVCYTGNA